jgi:hypothetical protein
VGTISSRRLDTPWEGACSRFRYRDAGHHRSHAPRGHAVPDAPRRKQHAERQQRRYHAERGNDQVATLNPHPCTNHFPTSTLAVD